MLRVLSCITTEHDLRLVVFAGFLCLVSCAAAMMLLQRAHRAGGYVRWIWLVSAGTSGGFGIWATHFVAMLAYDASLVLGYEPSRTLLSLAISVTTTFLAVTVASLLTGRLAFIMAGILFGLGVSTMHFVGMTAIEFPGAIHWNATLVWSAILLAVLFSVPGFACVSLGRRSPKRLTAAASLLTLGVVSMHFTSMGGVVMTPMADSPLPSNLLSPALMVIVIATTALSLLFSVLAAALFASRSENATMAMNTRFRHLVQGVSDYAIYLLDPSGRVTNWNVGAQRMKGYADGEIVGKNFAVFYSEDERANGAPEHALRTALATGKFETEGWRYRKDGTAFWASVVIDPIYDEHNDHIGFAKITRDCTEAKDSAARLLDVTNNLSIALNTMGHGIALFDANERLILHNELFREIIEFPRSLDIVGRTFHSLCYERFKTDQTGSHDADGLYEQHRALFMAPGGGETAREVASGRTIRTVHRPTGDGSFVMTLEDITARVDAEEKIRHLARHDALTGLANRHQFGERLDAAIETVSGSEKVAAICIDLDDFKEINDRYGHAMGDKVLYAVASRMQKLMGENEAVGRFGGDEFVAFKRFVQEKDLEDFIGRLFRALTERIVIDGTEILPGASIGVSVYPSDAADREKLLNNADMAMYRSKAQPEQRISFYEAAMDEAARERRAMGRDLGVALEERQFFLVYQVQKSARTRETTGYEVLLRWRHPQRGLISPATFIPIAEECGLISPIGDWVLEEACREAVAWGLGHKIAVNLSPLQLGDVSLVDKVRSVLLRTGLPPSRLELEVTESAIIGDKGRALHILRQIRAMGVMIAIDDFGTGYSSLETLRVFPFDKIKLDRSFVNELDGRQSKAFIRAIVALGKSLDVTILAEGAETEEQLHVLVAEGCDEVQGFLFGRPCPIEALQDRSLNLPALTA
ncbi:PAS domain S-box-containing protein/diguanylate cyclase (GGDEF)-like protein [Rhizobium sp. PP-F2F-G38]|nr:PAS domain S-box-containing protein/diguanylate cyclase (GGDEF)-like protein [Rhizobium sp. PP-WC-1G-195]PYF00928.1 PAS domain S-box-containing protein/diguanylate cyclase (GGDEF)-like protein [Rhizobium sp. PP-F2F-G38]